MPCRGICFTVGFMSLMATTIHSSVIQTARANKDQVSASGCAGVSEESLTPAKPNSRERFLNACHCLPLDRPPIWLMRQAGRALPEYLALKEKHSFLEM